MTKKKKKSVKIFAGTVRRETELERILRHKDQLPDAREIYIMLRGKWGKPYDGMHTGPIKDLS